MVRVTRLIFSKSIRATLSPVRGPGIALGFAAPDHVYIQLRDHVPEIHRRMAGVKAGSPQPFFLADVPDKETGALRMRAGEIGVRDLQDRHGPRTVIIRAIV